MTDHGTNRVPPDDELIARLQRTDALGAIDGTDSVVDDARLVANVLAKLSQVRTRRRRRQRWIAAGVAVALAGGGTVAWAALHRERASISFAIICADRAALSADGSIDARQVIIDSDHRPPAQQCREVWDSGGLGTTVAPLDLASCVGPGGTALVVPGQDPDICVDLGLPALDRAVTTDGLAEIRLQHQLSDYLADAGCIGTDTLVAFVEDALRDVGLGDWKVELGNHPSAQQPCATAMLQPVDQTVLIEHWPDISTPTPPTEET